MTDPQPPTEIVPSADTQVVRLPPAPDDLVVLATNPAEMQQAQTQLLAWADRKLEIVKVELEEAKQNLAECKKLKVKTAAWAKQVKTAEGRVVAYEKIRAAIAEGYYIVPNFPVQLIAVRTTAKKPAGHVQMGWDPPQASSNLPALGDGRYVNTRIRTRITVPEGGIPHHRPTAFTDFDFPFQVVKPKVLSDLDHAMKLKIFDEIGILPTLNTTTTRPRLAAGDPMLVGVIRRRENTRDIAVMFLISWWIDTRSL